MPPGEVREIPRDGKDVPPRQRVVVQAAFPWAWIRQARDVSRNADDHDRRGGRACGVSMPQKREQERWPPERPQLLMQAQQRGQKFLLRVAPAPVDLPESRWEQPPAEKQAREFPQLRWRRGAWRPLVLWSSNPRGGSVQPPSHTTCQHPGCCQQIRNSAPAQRRPWRRASFEKEPRAVRQDPCPFVLFECVR